MEVAEKYVEYWRKRRIESQLFNQQLAEKARNSLPKIITLLTERFGATKIILFGSLVRGGFNQDSDIDLAVSGIANSDYFSALAQVSDLTDFIIDLKPVEDLEPYFLQRVLETGEIIYERD